MSYTRNYVENDKDLEIYTIEDFLTDEECDHFCDLIRARNTKSRVAGQGYEASIVDDNFRTSSTSTLDTNDPIVNEVNIRMTEEVDMPLENGESVQGQIYLEGQQFKHHHDYFSGSSYNNHCLYSGQRVWTVMIYLNDVEEGGETDFKDIGITFKPKKRMAVIWRNSHGTGKENPASIHAGMPVIKGEKIVITKWFRENKWDIAQDILKRDEMITQKKEEKIFSNSSNLPKLTPLGFKVVKVPDNTWRLIQEAYKLLQNVKTVETWNGMEKFIHDEKGEKMEIEIFNMDNCFRIKEIIQEELLPVHQEFVDNKEAIKPLWIYGIRSYKRGAILEPHVDTIQTHHVSSIIIVDKQVDKDWPLDIQDHEGNWHKIYAEPGDMILYESATCKHGRLEPFEGEFYRNFYLHYSLADYKYQP